MRWTAGLIVSSMLSWAGCAGSDAAGNDTSAVAHAGSGGTGGGMDVSVLPPAGTAGSMAGAGAAGTTTAGAGASGAGGAMAAGTGGAGSGGATVAGADGGGAGGTGGDAASAGTGGGPGTVCTGKPGAPGLAMRNVAGRNVLVHIPREVDPNTGVPLLFVHHGYTMDGEAMRTLTGFQTIADREGFVVAFPDGVDATWNVGADACGVGALGSGAADDLAFVHAIIASIEADQCLSREHVFMTGFSMGGYFSNHAACRLGDVVRGIAPHSGGTYPGACTGGPIPVMIWHGSADFLVDPSCGTNARDLWVARNGCQSTFDTVPVTGGTCERHHGCPPGGQVVLCMMNGMSHQWAGGAAPIGAPDFENASEMMWAFFKEQSGL